MYVLCCFLWSQRQSVYTAPRVEVVSGLVREDNFVPSRRFHEDGLESFKAVNGGGSARVNALGAPAVAKRTKPIDSDSLQVQVGPVVSTHLHPRKNKTI